MLFKGRLRLPGDAGEGIPIDVTLEDVYLTLDSDGEELGEWRLDVVEISRLFSNQFSLLLDGEEMVFVASDALGFAYEGLSFIEEVQSRLKKRRFFKGRKPKRSKAKPVPAELPPEEPARSTPASAPVPDAPIPEVKPFFPEPAAELRGAGQDAPAPRTSERPFREEPVAEPASEPSRRSLHPFGDPDEDVVEPYLEQPARAEEPPPAPASAPVARDIPDPFETFEPVREPAAPAPDVEDEAEDELVIEDVNPYGYQSPVTMIPEKERRSDSEPAAAPRPEPEPELEPEPEETEPEVPAARVEMEPEPLVEDEPSEPRAAATAMGSTPEPVASADHEAPFESEVEHDPQPEKEPSTRVTQRTGRHAKGESKARSSLFGRRKSKEPEPHDHVYESSKTVGGITRSVCSVCGHVSFAGEDVYQNW